MGKFFLGALAGAMVMCVVWMGVDTLAPSSKRPTFYGPQPDRPGGYSPSVRCKPGEVVEVSLRANAGYAWRQVHSVGKLPIAVYKRPGWIPGDSVRCVFVLVAKDESEHVDFDLVDAKDTPVQRQRVFLYVN
jgi:hypothetical protein